METQMNPPNLKANKECHAWTLRITLVILALVQSSLSKITPVMLITFIKYGVTTPFVNFNTTKYGDRSNFKKVTTDMTPMVITETGKRQVYNMGKYFYDAYKDDKIMENIKHSNIYILSSQVTRTVTAASAFMLGMFNSTDKLTTTNDDLRLQPKFKRRNSGKPVEVDFDTALPEGWSTYSILTTNENYDRLMNLNSKDVCPNKNLLTITNRKKELESMVGMSRLESAIREVAGVYGIDISKTNFKDSENCFYYFNLIHSDYFIILDPIFSPTNDKKDTYNFLKDCYEAYIMTLYGTDADLTLAASPFVMNIATSIEYYISNFTRIYTSRGYEMAKKKFLIYSGHEKLFVPLLYVLGMANRSCFLNKIDGKEIGDNCATFPHYASSILFEILLDDKDRPDQSAFHEFYIRVRYNDEYMDIDGMTGDVLNEEKYMNAQEVLSYLKRNTNHNWSEDCGINQPSEAKIETEKWILIMTVSNVGLLFALLLAFCFILRKKSSNLPQDVEEDMDVGRVSIGTEERLNDSVPVIEDD